MKNQRSVVLVLLLLYLVSFALPAAVFQRGSEWETWFGLHCALSSIFGGFILQFEGFANVLMLIAFVHALRQKWESAAGMAAYAILLASETFTLFFFSFPANEGGVGPPYQLRILHVGFFAWYGSMWALMMFSNRQVPNPNDASDKVPSEESSA